MTRSKQQHAADDLAVWVAMIRSDVDERFKAMRSKPLEEQRAWMRRCLPQHILDALPHLPLDLRAPFLAQEVYRRMHELAQVAYAHPAKVARVEAMRSASSALKNDKRAAKQRTTTLDRVQAALVALPTSTKPHERASKIARKLSISASTVRKYLPPD